MTIEPLAVGVHAIKRGKLKEGESVVIVGAGPIGICTTMAAKAGKIIVLETSAGRRAFAKEAGATEVIDPKSTDPPTKAVKDLTNGMGADCSFECVGAEATLKLALNTIRKDGRVVVIGIFEHPAVTDYFDVVFFDKNDYRHFCIS